MLRTTLGCLALSVLVLFSSAVPALADHWDKRVIIVDDCRRPPHGWNHYRHGHHRHHDHDRWRGDCDRVRVRESIRVVPAPRSEIVREVWTTRTGW